MQYLSSSLKAFEEESRCAIKRGGKIRGSGRAKHRGCGLIEAANQEFPGGSPETNLRSSRTVVGRLLGRCLETAPHCFRSPLLGTRRFHDVSNEQRRRHRTACLERGLRPSSLVEEHSSKISSFDPYLLRCYLHFSRYGRFNRSKEFYPDW